MLIRVMIFSENAGERARLQELLGQWPDFLVSARSGDSYDALEAARSFLPHVALISEEPSILDCPRLVSALKRWSPRTRTLVLTSRPENRAVLDSLASGAAGYLLRDKDAEVVPAVIWVYRGGALMTTEIVSRAFAAAPEKKPPFPGKEAPAIDRTEFALASLIGRGLSNKEIAGELSLSNGSVRNRVSSLLKKTGLRSRTELALFAHHRGILGDSYPGGNESADFPREGRSPEHGNARGTEAD
jgi:DNA-binding NarL/FixJ family response regulator